MKHTKVIHENNKLQQKIEKKRQEIKDLESKIRTSFLSDFGCELGDKVTMHLLESREDHISCFQAEQKAEVILVDIAYLDNSKYCNGEPSKFLYPVIKKSAKVKKNLHYNQFLSWKLIKNDKVILEHHHEDIIIADKYTEDELIEIRKRCSESQKI